MDSIEARARLLSLRARIAEDLEKQKRHPAGRSDGGQFASEGKGSNAGSNAGKGSKGGKPTFADLFPGLASFKPGSTLPGGAGAFKGEGGPPPPQFTTGGYKPGGFNAPQYGMGTVPGGKPVYAPPKNAKPHPKMGDDGKPVLVEYPSKASDAATWRDPKAAATFIPGGETPVTLNGVKLAPWTDHPVTHAGWAAVEGQNSAVDRGAPPLPRVPGKHPAAGVIIEEADGRVWLLKPTNHFGGYEHTFPKGSTEAGHGLQATAIKEAFEESGLKIQITGVLGDYERSTSVARMFTAKRVGGTPSQMGWESQAARLVPRSKVASMLNVKTDRDIMADYFMEADLGKAKGQALPLIPPAALSFAAVILAAIEKAKGRSPSKGGAWEKQPRWPAGPLGGQWKTFDGDGVLMPPALGSAQNPVYTKKGAALYGLAKVGDLAGLKAQTEALKAKVASIPAGKTLNFHDKQYGKLAEYATALFGLQLSAPKAEAQAFEIKGVILSIGDYKKVGEKPGGSNPGAMYEDEGGQKWLAKGNAQFTAGAVNGKLSDDRAHSEVLTAKLLQAVGVGAPNMAVADFAGAHGTAKSGQGSLGVLSQWVPGGAKLDASNPQHVAAVQADFAVHAWLANWDSVGLGYDNTVIIGGKAVCIDPGGALGFRAQGLPKYKDGKLPTVVSELSTLRDASKNAQAAKFYGSMTPAQLAASASKLTAIDDATIKALVQAHGPGNAADKADMTAALIARRDNVLATLGGGAALSSAPVKEVAAVAAPAVMGVDLASAPDKTAIGVMTAAGVVLSSGDLPPSAIPAGLPSQPKHYSGGGMTAKQAKTVNENANDMTGAHAVGNIDNLQAKINIAQTTLKNGVAGEYPKKVMDAVAANIAFGQALMADLKGQAAPARVVAPAGGVSAANTNSMINGIAVPPKPEHPVNSLSGQVHRQNAGKMLVAAKTGNTGALLDILNGAEKTLKAGQASPEANKMLQANITYGKTLLAAMNGVAAPAAAPVKPFMEGGSAFAVAANKIANMAGTASSIQTLEGWKDTARDLQAAALDPKDVAGIASVIGFIDAKLAALNAGSAPAATVDGPVAREGLPPVPDFGKVPDLDRGNAAGNDHAAMMAPMATAAPTGSVVNPLLGSYPNSIAFHHGEKMEAAYKAGDVATLVDLTAAMTVKGYPLASTFGKLAAYGEAALKDLAGKTPAAPQSPALGKPTFPNEVNAKTLNYYNGLASKASDLHAAGALTDLKALSTTEKGGPAWPSKTQNGKIMGEFHAKLVADLEAKQGQAAAAGKATLDQSAGFDTAVVPPRLKSAMAQGMSVAPPMAMPAKPKVSSPANPNVGLASKLDAIESAVAQYADGQSTKAEALASISAHTFGSNTYGKAGAKYQAGVIASLAGGSAPEAIAAAAVKGSTAAKAIKDPASPTIPATIPAGPKAALQGVIAELKSAHEAGDAGQLETTLAYAKTTLGVMQAGSEAVNAMKTIIAYGDALEAVGAAKIAAAAAAISKPKSAVLTQSEMPATVSFSSSKPWKVKNNTDLQEQIKAFGLAGDYKGLLAMKFAELKDDADGTPTGNTPPIQSHPSKFITAYHSSVATAMREKMHPPKPLQVFAVTKAGTIDAVSKAFPPAPLKTNAEKLPSNQKFGDWAALGQVADPSAYAPPAGSTTNLSSSQVENGKEAYKSYSALTKEFVSNIQAKGGSNSMNGAYRAGKETYNGTNLKAMAKAVLADATTLPTNSTLHRWQDMSPAMIASIKAAKPGLILDSLGPMCASYDPTSTSIFGPNKINIIAAKGAKGIHSHATGKHKTEREVSIIPGSRFIFLGYKTKSNGHVEMDLLMLPPSEVLD